MKRDTPKSVVIVVIIDPLTGGHHDIYKRIYSSILNAMGFKVRIAPSIEEEETTNPLKLWFYAREFLEKISIEEGKKPDLVMFLWIDSYLSPYLPAFLIDRIFPYDWFGLYFHPRHLRMRPKFNLFLNFLNPDLLFQCEHCKAIGVLDSGVAKRLQNKIWNKPVIPFPVVIDTDVENTDTKLITDIRRRSKGRKVLGILGSLEKRKGILTAIKLAEKYKKENLFFVFAGELAKETFSGEEQKIIFKVIEENPENCYFYPKKIDEDNLFNSIISICDLIFLEYINFPHSSNLLVKAAFFKKPVIVSRGYYMDEIVRKYGMGKSVEQGNVDDSFRAIKSLLYEKDFNPGGFAKFYKDNSISNLRMGLAKMIDVAKK